MDKLINSLISDILKTRDDVNDAQSERDNSRPEWSAILNRPQKFLSDYADFDAALTAAGKTAPTDLIVNRSVSITANKNVPANINLIMQDSGMFTVSAGVTLTVGSMRDPGNRQIFAGAGAKLFGSKAVQFYNLQWWIPRTDFADITAAFNDAYKSCGNNGGGLVVIPSGSWLSSGGHIVPSDTTTMGVGGSRVYAAANNIALFRVNGTGNRRAVNFDNFIINGYYQNSRKTGLRGIVANADAGQIYLLSCKRMIFEIVETAIHHEAQTHGEGICWEFENCATSDGTTAFKCDSVNSSQLFTNCRFHVDFNGIIFDLKYTGGFEANKCLFISVPNSSGGLPNSGATVIKTFGTHNVIKFTGCQDESVEYFLKTDINDFAAGLFILEENLIQSKIQPSADTTIYSRNNKYVWDGSGNVKGNVAGANLAFYSDDDEFTVRVGADPEVLTENIGVFAGGSFIARHVSRLNRSSKFTGNTQFLQKLISPNGETDSGTTPPFANKLRPALEALTEVDTTTHPGVNHPFFRIGVKTPTGNTAAWQFGRDPVTGNLIVSSNMPGFDTIQFSTDGIALKSPTGVMRKLVLNNDGTVTSVPL